MMNYSMLSSNLFLFDIIHKAVIFFREYLVRTLEAEDQAIAEDKVKIEEYRRESDKLRKIIHALKTEAVVFQSTKCSASDQV